MIHLYSYFLLTDKVIKWAQDNRKRDIEHVHHLVAVSCSCTWDIVLWRQADPSLFPILDYFTWQSQIRIPQIRCVSLHQVVYALSDGVVNLVEVGRVIF